MKNVELTRRQLFKLPIALLPQGNEPTLDDVRIDVKILELKMKEWLAALDNSSNASFLRDERILSYVADKFGEELGLTYYGQILDMVGRGE